MYWHPRIIDSAGEWRGGGRHDKERSCEDIPSSFSKNNAMASPAALSDLGPKETAPPSGKDGSGAIPSGFILKLYQMVNGAPDDVISWTPSGDAFRIGSDLNRLEAETLPHYFRHSRFQSLVRQLNFYNFRKVNRERTFWIYKHRLFHRDRPQDLHLLRRRTCPGVDGRKNRFSGVGNRKSSSVNKGAALESLEGREAFSSHNYSSNSREHSGNDESSLDGTSDEDSRISGRSPRKKRSGGPFGRVGISDTKRSRRDSRGGVIMRGGSYFGNKLDDSVTVDLSLVSSGSSASGTGQDTVFRREVRSARDDDDDDNSLSDKDERSEMIEQSLVVSQVAMKLEEYARKAKKAQGQSRTRRGGVHGVVTPPHPKGQLSSEYSSAYGVITYDDEYESDSDFSPHKSVVQERKSSPNDSRRRSDASNVVVTDGDDSLTSDDERASCHGSVNRVKCVSESNSPVHKAPKALLNARPVADAEIAKAVTRTLLASTAAESGGSMVVSSVIASFCMTTPPTGGDDLCSQILQLISSYECLAAEFQQYRAALHPLECAIDMLPPCTFSSGFKNLPAVSMRQMWESEACRNDAVRDFKTFAVNCITWVLDQTSETDSNIVLSEEERSALSHTANVWLTSATF